MKFKFEPKLETVVLAKQYKRVNRRYTLPGEKWDGELEGTFKLVKIF